MSAVYKATVRAISRAFGNEVQLAQNNEGKKQNAMTLTIDLDAAEEARLTAAARREGVAPTALLKNLVNGLPPPQQSGTVTPQEEARLATIRAARGSMAGVGVTAEDLHRERRSDRQREERQTVVLPQ